MIINVALFISELLGGTAGSILARCILSYAAFFLVMGLLVSVILGAEELLRAPFSPWPRRRAKLDGVGHPPPPLQSASPVQLPSSHAPSATPQTDIKVVLGDTDLGGFSTTPVPSRPNNHTAASSEDGQVHPHSRKVRRAHFLPLGCKSTRHLRNKPCMGGVGARRAF